MMSTSTKTDEKTLAPIEIWVVMLDNSTIKFHKPLVLQPEWLPDDPEEPDDNEYLSVNVPELNISSWGRDYDELLIGVQDDIRMMWKTFAQQVDVRLGAAERAIKRNYLAIAEEVIDG